MLRIHFQTFFRIMLLGAMVVLVQACSSGAVKEGMPLPELTFAHLAPVHLNVAEIKTEQIFEPDQEHQKVINQMPISPNSAVLRYFDQRYVAAGNEGRLIIQIIDTTVSRAEIEPEGRFSKLIGINKKQKYNAMAHIDVRFRRNTGSPASTSSVTARRTLTMPQNISLAEKDARLLEMIEDLVDEIDSIMIQSFDQTFGIIKNPEKVRSATPEMR